MPLLLDRKPTKPRSLWRSAWSRDALRRAVPPRQAIPLALGMGLAHASPEAGIIRASLCLWHSAAGAQAADRAASFESGGLRGGGYGRSSPGQIYAGNGMTDRSGAGGD